MQRRFPLLDLPNLPFENVYGYLEFEDLIHLASCSNRLKSLIQTMEQKQKKLTDFCFGKPTLENEFYVRRLSLNDKSQGQTRKEFVIFSYTSMNTLSRVSSRKNIGGRVWNVFKNDAFKWIVEPSDECQLFWFEYLKDLFNCRTEIRLNLDGNCLATLLPNTDMVHVADMTTISFSQISAIGFTYLLKDLQIEKLEITFQDTPRLQLSELIIRSRCLTLERAQFLELRHVWKIVQGGICRQVDLHNIEVPCSQEINQFIKSWLDSDNTTFEVLEFDVRVFRDPYEHILLGIPSLPGCKKREDAAEYYNNCTLYEEGRDIRRKDGLLATFVEKSTGQLSRRFSFTVWYCLDPNVLTDDNN